MKRRRAKVRPAAAVTAATMPAPAPPPAPSWSPRRLGPLALLLLVAAAYSASHMDIAVDTWNTLAGGRHILAHGVSTAEPFSFDSRQPPSPAAGRGPLAAVVAWLHPSGWINQAWLTYAGFAALAGAAGLDALVAWKYVTYALVAVLLVLTARARRATPGLAFTLAAGALLAGRAFFEVRAQDVTNLLAAALMLLLAIASVRAPRAIWLLVPLFAVWANAHGGFVWGLVALVVYAAGSLAGARLGRPFFAPAPGDLARMGVAAAASLAACVVTSPFRLANLTHPLLVSFSGEAREWRSVAEWLPLLEGSAGERGVFIAGVLVAAIAAIAYVRAGRTAGSTRREGPEISGGEGRPPFDLGATAVLAVTAAMAVSSRRFLPMAYLVGAPLLAQWLTPLDDRVRRGRLAGAIRQRLGGNRLTPARVSEALVWVAAIAAAAAFLVPFARTFWGPWPLDDRRVSFADRIFQTVGEPWEACEFVARNRLQGRMWNYWEFGGFWAWCQSPDAASGRIPLQIVFDGRAQQAYDTAAHRAYVLLEAGGPPGLAAERAQRQPAAAELEAIRTWVGKRLTEDKVWLAHVASRNQESQLARALFSLSNWEVVYQDANHTLLADTGTPEGKTLARRVDDGTAAFPDEASRLLTRASRALPRGNAGSAPAALALAKQAYAARPSLPAVALAAGAARDPAVLAEATAFCRSVADDVIAHREEYARRHGYYERLATAAAAAQFLVQAARTAGDDQARLHAGQQLTWLAQEAERVLVASEWS